MGSGRIPPSLQAPRFGDDSAESPNVHLGRGEYIETRGWSL